MNITDPDKYVPAANISLDVTGPVSLNRSFALNGTPILGGNPAINITPVNAPQPDQFGYGYGYGVDSRSGAGYHFGYGYGYGYGYGGGGVTVTYTYNVTIDSTSLPVGTYDANAKLNTGKTALPSFNSAKATFEITTISQIIPVQSSTGKGTLYFETNTGTIENLTAVNVSDIPVPPPAGVNLYYGLFRFNITSVPSGGSANLTLTFPDNLPAGTTYWKFGANATNHTPHWYAIPLTISGNKLTITLTDGGLGDDDLTANGLVKDDGGPSIPDTTPPVINSVTLNTTAPHTGMAILVTVNATDDVAVTSVEANGTSLIYQGGNVWNGTIIAVEGTHSVNVSARDVAGNIAWNNSTSYTATISSTEDHKPPSSGSGSGSGSSTGGGVITLEPFDNIARTETVDRDLLANMPVSYTFSNLGECLYEIDATGSENENDVSIRVEELKGTSKLVKESAPGSVYKNFNIWAGSKKIKDARLRCKIENSWLQSNGIASSDMKILRWSENKWQLLDTADIKNDGIYTFFEAKTPGFSPFALTGLKGGVLPTATPTVTQQPEETPTGTGTAMVTQTPTSEAPSVNLSIIIAVIVLIAIAAVVYIKRKEIFKK